MKTHHHLICMNFNPMQGSKSGLFSLLIFLSFILASLHASAEGLSGSQEIESLLSSERAYNIPRNSNIMDWFQTLIINAQSDTDLNPSHLDQNAVVIGDAFHWIGHILEDRGEFLESYSAFWNSYRNYLKSKKTHSIFISNLNTLEHAKMHIHRVGEVLKRQNLIPSGFENFDEDHIDSTKEKMQSCLQIYREYASRIANASKSCEKSFKE